MLKHLFVALVTVAGLSSVNPLCRAQSALLDLPRDSQHSVVTQRIGITDITINYHRPLVKGRPIWGKLVPYNEVWRAGANENTTITVTDAVSIEGKPLTKGVYGVFMIPGQNQWTIIFSKVPECVVAHRDAVSIDQNVSRAIDIDLLYAGDTKIDDEQLHIPHPRMHERRFVLEPLAEIRPDLVLPNQTQTAAALLQNLRDSAGVVRLKDQW